METFVLKSQRGTEHSYSVQPHPASEGTRLVLTLMGLAGEPLGRLFQSKAAELITQFQAGEVSLDSDLGGLLQSVPWAEVARDVRTALASVDGQQLFLDILKYTLRDNQQLSSSGVFDIAYQQNYIELLRAVWKVVEVNGFLGFIGSSLSA